MALLLYGATGYTGRLIARIAHDYGLRPILSGRNAEALRDMAQHRSLDYRVFSLSDDASVIDEAFSGITVVLHCAGPFIHTSAPMASACIRNGAHYVDITGEIEVFEQLYARDSEAKAAGVMLLPGAGFDVVPSDCLAAFLKQKLPSATHLTLGISGTGNLSRGTASTMVEHSDRGGMIRRNGHLTRVKPAWKSRTIDFGEGPRDTVTIPWGDVATSYYSTGIPNVEVYSALPPSVKPLLVMTRYLGWLMRKRWMKDLQLKRIRARPAGPSKYQLEHGKSYVWGEVSDQKGNRVEGRVTGPNGYLLTAHTALMIARRILAGDATPGFRTPSLAYGPDLILGVPGVKRT